VLCTCVCAAATLNRVRRGENGDLVWFFFNWGSGSTFGWDPRIVSCDMGSARPLFKLLWQQLAIIFLLVMRSFDVMWLLLLLSSGPAHLAAPSYRCRSTVAFQSFYNRRPHQSSSPPQPRRLETLTLTLHLCYHHPP
jgi:hypothetical protein